MPSRGANELEPARAIGGQSIGIVGADEREELLVALRGSSVERFVEQRSRNTLTAQRKVHVGPDCPDVLEGRIQPGRVFDREIDIDKVPDGYREMNDRKAIKVMIDFA